ncbi:MAG: DUF2800 domain-containing protein [Clostridia bacterium]
MSAHALLSASAADRWLHCPPSARLTEGLPDTAGPAAAEGTLAHAIAELHLRKLYVEPMTKRKFNTAFRALTTSPLFNAEMLMHVDAYLDYIEGQVLSFNEKPHIAVEKRLDLSKWVPDGFGTGDCILIGEHRLVVIDFKYGKGNYVETDHNPQLMLYALGALEAYSPFYHVDTVTMSIVQPRMNNLAAFTLTPDALHAWADAVVAPAATLAFAGEGETAAGDWCKYCQIRGSCRVRCERQLSEDFGDPPPPARLLSPAEVGGRITQLRPLVKLLKDLEDYALTQCLSGNPIPGFKAVAGRAERRWTDEDAAFAAAKAAKYDEAALYVRKPLTLAALETLMGTKTFTTLLGDYVIKPPGKPTLVAETDVRPPLLPRKPEDDFTKIEEVPTHV